MPDTEARLRAALKSADAALGFIAFDPACAPGAASKHALKAYDEVRAALSAPSAPAAEPDRTPEGYRRIEAYTDDKEIVAMEWPKENDEMHNCDALGCSSVEHVKYRAEIPGWQLGQDEPREASEAAIRADQRQKDAEIARNVAAEYERDNADTVDTIMHQMYAHMAAGARAAAAAIERADERGGER